MRRTGMALGMLVCVLVGCGPGLGLTPTEPGTCKKLAGAYASSYGNSCGHFSSNDAVTLTQTGCTITGVVPGVGTATGTITNATDVTWKVDFGTECKGTGAGTGKIEGTRITGTYIGQQTGSNCCSTVSGTFTLFAK